MTGRRAVLQAAVVLPLAAACAPDVFGSGANAVRIAVPWGGSELDAFRNVLSALPFAHAVELISLGDDVGSGFGGGRSGPDIVMLPQAGEVPWLAEHGRLTALDDGLWNDERGARFSDLWRPLVWVGTGRAKLYGLPFKATCKSLVWYDKRAFRDLRLPTPENWAGRDWGGWVDTFAQRGLPLLALGAADGWVLSDFFDNMLWAESPSAYTDIASPGRWDRDRDGPAVIAALRGLAGIWGRPHAFPGGIGKTLTRQFPDAIGDVFAHRKAAMVVAPDFAEPIVRACFGSDAEIAEAVGVMPFPGGAGGAPVIAGGDVMVLTAAAKPAAAELISLLASPDAPLPWMTRYHGFLAANLHTTAVYSPLLAPLADRVEQWTAFDLGDRIGAREGRNELWRTLTAFLSDLDQHDAGSAVVHAVDAIDALSRSRAL